MQQNSMQRRLLAAVMLSQLLLAAGLLLAGVLYTHRRLLATLDAALQSRAMSVAALVRYTEDATGRVYFDDTLMPESIDPRHPDLFAVWTERSGLLARSAHWPVALEISPGDARTHWNFRSNRVPYHALRVSQVPILDREEGTAFQPQTLTIVYATPMLQLQSQVREAGVFIALASLLLLGATGLLALWGIRRGLRPLEHLAAQATHVSAEHWEFRVPEDAQQVEELRPLTRSMAHMLERLERSFAEQREFVECRSRTEDAGGGAEIHPAVVAATSAGGRGISPGSRTLARRPGTAGRTFARDAAAGPGRTIGTRRPRA